MQLNIQTQPDKHIEAKKFVAWAKSVGFKSAHNMALKTGKNYLTVLRWWREGTSYWNYYAVLGFTITNIIKKDTGEQLQDDSINENK